jgi:hypothetical protein
MDDCVGDGLAAVILPYQLRGHLVGLVVHCGKGRAGGKRTIGTNISGLELSGQRAQVRSTGHEASVVHARYGGVGAFVRGPVF